MTDNELTDFLSNPQTPKPVHAVALFDGMTGLDLCVKFIDGKPASAIVGKGEGERRVSHRFERCRKGWVLPDTWKQRRVILELLEFIEKEERNHASKNKAA